MTLRFSTTQKVLTNKTTSIAIVTITLFIFCYFFSKKNAPKNCTLFCYCLTPSSPYLLPLRTTHLEATAMSLNCMENLNCNRRRVHDKQWVSKQILLRSEKKIVMIFGYSQRKPRARLESLL